MRENHINRNYNDRAYHGNGSPHHNENAAMIITPKPSTAENSLLITELERRGYDVRCFNPRKAAYHSDLPLAFEHDLERLEPKRALLRGFGREKTQKVFFRLHFVKLLEDYGIRLINSSKGLEMSSDKFYTSVLLEKHGIPTPATIVCQNSHEALEAFEKLDQNALLKPLIGSKGIGITRLEERGFAERVIYSLSKFHEVYYLQEFVAHFQRDIRILVVGDEAIAGMYRVSDNWKTNLSAGAHPEPLELTPDLKSLAVDAARALNLDIAGVDIIEREDKSINGEKYCVLEVNSVPGFTALQEINGISIAERIVDYFLSENLIYKSKNNQNSKK